MFKPTSLSFFLVLGAVAIVAFFRLFAGGAFASSSPLLDFEKTQGEYLGFGIGIHPGDVLYEEAFDELGLEYVRMELGPLWYAVEERIPEGASIGELRDFVERNYNGDAEERLDGAKYSHDFLRKRDIEIILIHFELPYQWRKDDKTGRFVSERIEDLAKFYTAHLMFLKEHGITIDYIELANEPDGHWNGHIPPEDYARLVVLCDGLFAANGLGDIKILGPGLAFLNLYGQTEDYMAALSKGAANSLDGWSAHTWDEVEFLDSKPEYAYGVWKPFFEGIAKANADEVKPLFLTEYGSDVTSFGDRHYTSPRKQIVGSVTDSWDYAVRVSANSVSHLNRGLNALVLYRLSNAHWHKTGWGIIQPLTRDKFTRKPVYNAMAGLFSDLPTNVQILEPTWLHKSDSILCAVLHDVAKGELTILAVNWTDDAHEKTLILPEGWTGEIVESISLHDEGTDLKSKAKMQSQRELLFSLQGSSMHRFRIKLAKAPALESN